MNTDMKIVFLCGVDEVNAKEQMLNSAEFGLLMHLQNRELQGKEPPTREELIDTLPVGERTLDGALASLKRRGLIQRQITYKVTEQGKAS